MNAMKIFSGDGDTTVAEWDETDVAQTEVAHGVFDAAKADGFAAVSPTPEGARPLGEFDPSAKEIFLLKPIAGG